VVDSEENDEDDDDSEDSLDEEIVKASRFFEGIAFSCVG
jgi:hypothetical protein